MTRWRRRRREIEFFSCFCALQLSPSVSPALSTRFFFHSALFVWWQKQHHRTFLLFRFVTFFNGKIYSRASRTQTNTPNVEKIKLSPINLRHSFVARTVFCNIFFRFSLFCFSSVFNVSLTGLLSVPLSFSPSLHSTWRAPCRGCIWQQITA